MIRTKLEDLEAVRVTCATKLLGLYKKANAGHIAPSLSCLDILIYLLFYRMQPQDVLVLSKGHAAAALYTVLKESGRMPECELDEFYQENTLLAAHPPCSRLIKEIPFGTGSLGHGLSLATGLCLSQRFTGKKFQVYTILSDGDCNEGSTWEAALFAAHHKLSNLTAIVDSNGIQGFGHTKDVLNMEPMIDKWRAFGFSVVTAKDGHSFQSLHDAHESEFQKEAPRCIIANTIKGSRVSYMENRMEWHYLPMSDAQFAQAIDEVSTLQR